MKPIVTIKNQQKEQLKKLGMQSSAERVLEVFLKYPEKEFSLSDVAKEAGVAKAHLGRTLTGFYNLGIIEITPLTNIWRIRANQRNSLFIKSKIIYNLNLIYQSNLVEFLEGYFNAPKAIVLFGSLRKGDDISTSDIDIAIEISGNKAYTILDSSNLPELGEYEKCFKRKIQLHIFTRKDIDINVFNNIANGIILFGFLEVKP